MDIVAINNKIKTATAEYLTALRNKDTELVEFLGAQIDALKEMKQNAGKDELPDFERLAKLRAARKELRNLQATN